MLRTLFNGVRGSTDRKYRFSSLHRFSSLLLTRFRYGPTEPTLSASEFVLNPLYHLGGGR